MTSLRKLLHDLGAQLQLVPYIPRSHTLNQPPGDLFRRQVLGQILRAKKVLWVLIFLLFVLVLLPLVSSPLLVRLIFLLSRMVVGVLLVVALVVEGESHCFEDLHHAVDCLLAETFEGLALLDDRLEPIQHHILSLIRNTLNSS